jgi:peptidoglycan/LPS O-acetylase OafA/YrhL
MLVSGFLALNFFFVISGFVMFLPVVRAGGEFGSVRAYAVRRVARIVPAFYVSIAGIIVLFPWVTPPGAPTFWLSERIQTLLAHLTFLHWEVLSGTIDGYYGVPGLLGFGVNGPYWSLSVEAVFYALLPICAGLYFRRPWIGLGIALVLSTLWRAASWRVPNLMDPKTTTPGEAFEVGSHLAAQFPAYMGNIALGMTAAWLFAVIVRSEPGSRLARVRERASLIQAASLAVLLVTMWLAGRDGLYPLWGTGPYNHYLRDTLPAIAFTVLAVASALCAGRARLLADNRLARWLGQISYGTYVWHVIVIVFLVWTVGWLPENSTLAWLKYMAVVIPTALTLGWLSFRFVERPVMDAARRYLKRRAAAKVPPAPLDTPTPSGQMSS